MWDCHQITIATLGMATVSVLGGMFSVMEVTSVGKEGVVRSR